MSVFLSCDWVLMFNNYGLPSALIDHYFNLILGGWLVAGRWAVRSLPARELRWALSATCFPPLLPRPPVLVGVCVGGAGLASTAHRRHATRDGRALRLPTPPRPLRCCYYARRLGGLVPAAADHWSAPRCGSSHLWPCVRDVGGPPRGGAYIWALFFTWGDAAFEAHYRYTTMWWWFLLHTTLSHR